MLECIAYTVHEMVKGALMYGDGYEEVLARNYAYQPIFLGSQSLGGWNGLGLLVISIHR